MNRTHCIIILWLFRLAQIGVADDIPPITSPPPKLYRVVIIDDSGSMATDNRIGVVRDELTKQLQQLPPSREYPIAIVTFGSLAKPAKTFFDLKSATEFLGTLNASSGSTNIAAGLAEANAELKNATKVSSVWVMLYSDGEDSNTTGILAEEAKLDAVFSDRSQRGLDQTVVFCKRWGGSNALLQQQIAKRGHTRVIDAGEAKLTTVTMEPKITVDAVRWLKDKPNWLEIDFRPSISVRGDAKSRVWPSVKWKSQVSDAEGDTEINVVPGASESPRRTLRMPVPADAIGKPSFPITFSIDEPNSQQTSEGLTIPLLAGTSMEVPVKLPDANLRNIITLGCDLSQPPRWSDPLQQKAAFPITLTFDVQAVDQSPMDRSSTFRVIPNSATAIIAGDPVIKLPGPGKYTMPLTLELSPKQIVTDLSKLRFAFQLTLRPEQVPANLTFRPSLLQVQQDNLAPPPPVRTRVEPRVQSTSSGIWTDLSQGLGSYSVDVQFAVHGPIPPGTKITIIAPATVRQFDFSPKTLRTGTQTVKVNLISAVSPAPAVTALQLQVAPPANQGAVEFECKQPLRLALPGPKPMRLLVSQGGELLSELSTSAADNDEVISVLVQPVVSGLKHQRTIGTLRATIKSATLSFGENAETSLEIFVPHAIPLKLPTSDLPFFTDSVIVGDVDFQPTPTTPAVIGSRYPVTITVQAPFKRLMVILAISLSSVMTVVLMGWMIVRLRHRDV